MDSQDTPQDPETPETPKSSEGQIAARILQPDETFGNFRVVKCLTEGLLANYYHMQHVRDLHDVTVGIFHHRTGEDAKFFKRLQFAQKSLQGVEHVSIPKIEDCAIINERHCIFQEAVRGQSLSQYFAANGTPGKVGLDPEVVTRIVAQLLGVLGYAHAKALDHRDLDSDLIFIADDGELQVLGLSVKQAIGVELFESIVSASVSPLESSKSIERLNTFDVMSPEYKAGLSEDSRVDIYSVGMIGYWLLTGHKPNEVDYVSVENFAPDLSENWDVFLKTCLSKESESRYQSCKLALAALQDTEVEEHSESASFVQRKIDSIPVPRGIAERGESASRVWRLGLIGLVGVTLTALAAAYLSMAYTEEEQYVRNVAEKAFEGEEPHLIVSVSPAVARLEFVKSGKRFISSDGQINLKVQPGEYQVKMTAPHHLEETATVVIPVERTEPISLTVELKPSWSDFEISSEPRAAISVIDDRGIETALGTTNNEGVFFLKKGIFAGTYQIVVKKKGYLARVLDDQEITFGEVTAIDVELEALPSKVIVRTQPDGARILVNEVAKGETPLTLESLVPGDSYLIVAHLDGYRSLGRRLLFEAGQDLEVDFGELIPRSGVVEFSVDFAGVSADAANMLREELSIEVDGQLMPYGLGVMEGIKEGPRLVRLIHPLYISERQQVDVQDRATIQLEVTMLPRPGVVEIVLPDTLNVSARLDGQPVELVDGRVEVAAGVSSELELRIKNHLTMKREVKLSPNESMSWEVKPVSIPGPQVGEAWTMPYLGHEFAWVEPGRFSMGSPPVESARLPNEGPQTQVHLTKGFWIGVHEVTQARFFEIMDSNPSKFQGADKPVDSVSWGQAKQFCEMLNRFEEDAGRLPEGYEYRLPTEAEWEYTARAGTTTPFSFGDEADATAGNFRGIYPIDRQGGVRGTSHYGTMKVGSYEPNALGLYDIHGNVQEWTLDKFNGRLPGGSLTDPAPRADGSKIAVRGGSWEDFAKAVRSACRGGLNPDTASNSTGLRVVLAPKR